VSFWRHCGSPSSPGRAKQGKKKKIFFSSITAISLFKKTPTPPPLARSFPRVREEGGDVFLGQFLGRQHSGHPNHVPPLFLPIKTGGPRKKRRRREEETEQKKKERGERLKERKKKKKTWRGRKKRKTERKEEKEKHKGGVATNTATAGTTATAGHHWRLRLYFTSPRKNSALFLLAFISSLAMQDVHGARLCRNGEASYCAHAQ